MIIDKYLEDNKLLNNLINMQKTRRNLLSDLKIYVPFTNWASFCWKKKLIENVIKRIHWFR